MNQEKSHSTQDLTSSAPKRGRSPQEEFSVKKLKFAMNEEERKKACSEAAVWAKLLFDELSKVADEIADIKLKEQFHVMNDDVNTRINDLFAKTERAEEKLQRPQLEYEGLRQEVETLKYARHTLSEDVNNAVKKLDEIEQYSRSNCLIFTEIKEESDPSIHSS